ncbi:unnamed protein product [Prorocentrum cordatum]|uniref:Uncharacterized protein n=1 Tax=Prorocentrum cordatum TaxID=2364126 RepID=A0ABN9WD77_9DINO|nr:unnamed protein product [Polarella glacialis]
MPAGPTVQAPAGTAGLAAVQAVRRLAPVSEALAGVAASWGAWRGEHASKGHPAVWALVEEFEPLLQEALEASRLAGACAYWLLEGRAAVGTFADMLADECLGWLPPMCDRLAARCAFLVAALRCLKESAAAGGGTLARAAAAVRDAAADAPDVLADHDSRAAQRWLARVQRGLRKRGRLQKAGNDAMEWYEDAARSHGAEVHEAFVHGLEALHQAPRARGAGGCQPRGVHDLRAFRRGAGLPGRGPGRGRRRPRGGDPRPRPAAGPRGGRPAGCPGRRGRRPAARRRSGGGSGPRRPRHAREPLFGRQLRGAARRRRSRRAWRRAHVALQRQRRGSAAHLLGQPLAVAGCVAHAATGPGARDRLRCRRGPGIARPARGVQPRAWQRLVGHAGRTRRRPRPSREPRGEQRAVVQPRREQATGSQAAGSGGTAAVAMVPSEDIADWAARAASRASMRMTPPSRAPPSRATSVATPESDIPDFQDAARTATPVPAAAHASLASFVVFCALQGAACRLGGGGSSGGASHGRSRASTGTAADPSRPATPGSRPGSSLRHSPGLMALDEEQSDRMHAVAEGAESVWEASPSHSPRSSSPRAPSPPSGAASTASQAREQPRRPSQPRRRAPSPSTPSRQATDARASLPTAAAASAEGGADEDPSGGPASRVASLGEKPGRGPEGEARDPAGVLQLAVAQAEPQERPRPAAQQPPARAALAPALRHLRELVQKTINNKKDLAVVGEATAQPPTRRWPTRELLESSLLETGRARNPGGPIRRGVGPAGARQSGGAGP